MAREVGRKGLSFGETFKTLAGELGLGRGLDGPLERKDAAFPAAPMYQNPNPFTQLSTNWSTSTPAQQLKQYSTNALVFACIRVIAESFAEAELCVYNKAGDKIPGHPLKKLIARPNPIMGEDELWKYFITYAGFGGSGFLHQVLARNGEPGELWPYHRLQMAPVPQGNRWVDHYSYDLGNGQYQRIETNEVIHWRWAIDPARPWDALSPLAVISKSIDTHDELGRYIKAVLENDAVPRGVLTLPADVILTQEKRNELKQDWNRRHGGKNRGGLAIMPAGGKYERAAFTFEELAADAFRGALEAEICQAIGVHPIVVFAKVGLDKSTYNNNEEAIRDFTRRTLVPKWRAVEAEMNSAFEGLMRSGEYLKFDLTKIEALKDDLAKKAMWVIPAFQAKLLSVNQALAELGKDAIKGGDDMYYQSPAPAPVAGALANKGGDALFAVGDRVEVAGKVHMAGQKTGTVKLVTTEGTYGIVFDGMEKMGVHKWYVGSELKAGDGKEGASDPAKPDGMGGMAAKKSLADGILETKEYSPEVEKLAGKFEKRVGKYLLGKYDEIAAHVEK